MFNCTGGNLCGSCGGKCFPCDDTFACKVGSVSILVMLAARIMCAITITVTCCSQIVAWQPILSQLVVPRELGGEAAFQRLRWTVPTMDADVVGVVLIAASECVALNVYIASISVWMRTSPLARISVQLRMQMRSENIHCR